MIIEELRHNNLNDSLRYCKILFDLDPVNPTVFLLPIAIFEELGKSVHLIEFFSSLLVDVSKPKILGNIFFHLGIVQVNNAKGEDAIKSFESANENFEKVFPLDDDVFKQIKEAIMFLNNEKKV